MHARLEICVFRGSRKSLSADQFFLVSGKEGIKDIDDPSDSADQTDNSGEEATPAQEPGYHAYSHREQEYRYCFGNVTFKQLPESR